MIDVIHPTGNANVRQVLRALYEVDALGHFYTSLGTTCADSFLWGRRHFSIPKEKLRLSPIQESLRLVLQKLPGQPLTRRETDLFSIDRVYRCLDRKVAELLHRGLTSPKAVYAYEDGAFHTFRVARNKGIARIYDLPIAYWEMSYQIYREEAERLPEWAGTLPGLSDSPEKLERKTSEIEMADEIICPSKFVLESLPPHIQQEKNITIARFGCEKVSDSDSQDANHGRGYGPLRILFVGALSQRKGLADLLSALRLLRSTQIQLTVVGSMVASASFYENQWKGLPVDYIPPQSHKKILEIMRRHDVFILPSLVEGRALVQLEALGMGLPLIITPNTGGEDCVIEGKTGFVVPVRSPESIAEKIDMLSAGSGQLNSMKIQAQQHSRKISWQNYRMQIKTIISANNYGD